MVIETERLELKRLTDADLDELVAMHSHPDVRRFLGAYERPQALVRLAADAHQWREHGHGLLAVRERSGGAFLGRVSLRHWPEFAETEIGWALRREAWGHGYATEAARACVAWGFANLDVPYLTAMIEPINARSAAVAGRLGMEPLRPDELMGVPVVVHAVDRAAWAGRPATPRGGRR
ncbi:MAG TPA: GNAT family N-acetyltransferase [Solirubrobacteraceae bacterium]|nr:GNAT family N-acetyltransferase [Solirubrobacteraceae bacterium]